MAIGAGAERRGGAWAAAEAGALDGLARLGSGRWGWWIAGTAAVVVALCLAVAHEAGFPLDDAWIHQDFARTLALTGRFAFAPGRRGAGSSSPLWALLLAPPHALWRGAAPLWAVVGWSAALGAAALGALGIVTGIAAGELARGAGAGRRAVGAARLLAGLAVVCEWHLAWAAASGMETDLFALAALGLLLAAARGARPAWLGLLAAAAVAVRPEGLLAGAVVAALAGWGAVGPALAGRRWGEAPRAVARWGRGWLAPYAVGLAAGLAPYAALNLAASGSALPSTFAAKAAYYGTWGTVGELAGYVAGVAGVVVVSSPVVVGLAALSYSHWLLARGDVRRGGAGKVGTDSGSPLSRGERGAGGVRSAFPLRAALAVWPLALVAAYAVHLPVVYQHGRYQMPILPSLIALATPGAARLLVAGERRLLARIGALALAAAALVSLGRAPQIYASDVRTIDGDQVSTARWLRTHTPPGSLVATHDIGAIGYFADRPVLDMAGLIDPQVIPLLGDQRALERFLRRHRAAYVAMFVDWFPPPAVLAHDLAGRAVHRATAAGPQAGPGATFVVYRTGW